MFAWVDKPGHQKTTYNLNILPSGESVSPLSIVKPAHTKSTLSAVQCAERC